MGSSQLKDNKKVSIHNGDHVPKNIKDVPLVIAGRSYSSRLIVGTGKYRNFQLMKDALEASGSSMVTVAVRRVNLSDRSEQSFWSYIPKGMVVLPKTCIGR